MLLARETPATFRILNETRTEQNQIESNPISQKGQGQGARRAPFSVRHDPDGAPTRDPVGEVEALGGRLEKANQRAAHGRRAGPGKVKALDPGRAGRSATPGSTRDSGDPRNPRDDQGFPRYVSEERAFSCQPPGSGEPSLWRAGRQSCSVSRGC